MRREAPIQINLDGTFRIPADGERYVVGDINPDLRLEHLDAFLEQLNGLLNDKPGPTNTARDLASGFAKVIATAVAASRRDNPNLEHMLEIRCSIDPASQQTTYSFNIQSRCKPSKG